ncbi:MAG TPA: nucleoside 2-deoxyribosyltransferase domain-containing protein [Sedimentibacter sp.]|nr:nucleoside 2-deoxyribosyltransferase domain-containing protein [Sedimentibacter sp.]
MKKVFLGGTCAESTWREKLISKLKISYFNPVVPDWTEECYQQELKERANCDYCLYVITPEMQGVYSIAEVVDDSNKQPKKTIFAFGSTSDTGFSKGQIKSLDKVGKMVERNGGKYFISLEEIADYLNKEE